MFAVNAVEKLTSVTTTIIQNVELSALLNGTYQTTEIPICPTQAISVVDNVIDNDRCIACGICKKLIPDAIEYSPETGDVLRFIDYCKAHKMFVYKWLCLSTDSLSGIEIFIRGFSRSKRIPFVSFDDRLLKIAKSAYNVRELQKVKADLDDILNLASSGIETFATEKIVVLIQKPSTQQEYKYLQKQSGCKILGLMQLYDEFMTNLL